VGAMLDSGSHSRIAPIPQQEIGLIKTRGTGDEFDHRTISQNFTSANDAASLRI
jgi:hypothetical protein